MDDLISEFITETFESLEELDVDLVNLEQNPNDQNLLSKIFRLKHTIKGTCGFLGLPRLEKVAHHAENVLGRFRDGDLEVTPEYVTLIFESIDRIKEIVNAIAETGGEPEGDDSALIAKLDAAFEGKSVDTTSAPDETTTVPDEPESEATPMEETSVSKDETNEEDKGKTPDDIDAELAAAFGEPVKAGETVTAASTESPAPAQPEEDSSEEGGSAAPSGGPPTQTLRVNVDVLENLMTMVSELVLTRNQLLQILRANTESDFSAPLQRLNHVVSDLQEGVMKTRMQPIGNAWAKLPRIIRDLSLELDKKIDLEMRGKDTELDRQVLELIKDPLTHMVRNSGDHGIETPAVRKEVGKPETGKIILDAYHEGGHIIITISDDGKGLPVDKIKQKIISNGLATEEELAGMADSQIQQFIFKPGFSTAEKVTSVSGRGVGMDVVRTNIEKIGGSVELQSAEGKGSKFTIKIPLTLAIVSALIVEAAKERFAIPQIGVRELVMTSEHGDNRIEMIKGTPVFRLRNKLLPLVSLPDLLKLRGVVGDEDGLSTKIAAEIEKFEAQMRTEMASHGQNKEIEEKQEETSKPEEAVDKELLQPEPETKVAKTEKKEMKEATESRNQYIVVTQVGSYDFGIIVDRVYDTEEIVVKPVASILRDLDLFSGNTILGDGSVIMILDPNGIARATGEMETADTMADAQAQEEQQKLSDSASKTSLLLFKAGDVAPKAVPLSLVARLENVDITTIEHSSGQMMVQYRGQLMPLIKFSSSMHLEQEGEKPVLVFNSEGDKSLGLIVDEIVDITEEHIKVQLDAKTPGLLGSAIINDKATDVVDVAHFLRSNSQGWFKNHGDEPFGGKASETSGRRVLLVDDSAFFRNMLTPLLSVAGYDVTSLESPIEALKMCEKGAQFDIILSDIEMPDMDGFEFAEKIRADSNWRNTPIVALTSHATPQDIDRGMKVGYTKYIAKFDRDTLLSTLSQTLAEAPENQREGDV